MPTVTQTVQEVKVKKEKRVSWTEDTIDNEHMNKKSSKVCCIFYKEGGNNCRHNKNKYDRI